MHVIVYAYCIVRLLETSGNAIIKTNEKSKSLLQWDLSMRLLSRQDVVEEGKCPRAVKVKRVCGLKFAKHGVLPLPGAFYPFFSGSKG
jgi:hypothetical protein